MVRGPDHDAEEAKRRPREVNAGGVPAAGEDGGAIAVRTKQEAKGLLPIDDTKRAASEDAENHIEGREFRWGVESNPHIIRIRKTASRDPAATETVGNAAGGRQGGCEGERGGAG